MLTPEAKQTKSNKQLSEKRGRKPICTHSTSSDILKKTLLRISNRGN